MYIINQVGMDRLKCVILLDISEDYSRQRLSERISHRDEVGNNNESDSIDCCLSIFKNQTLQACKIIDDDEKLRVVSSMENHYLSNYYYGIYINNVKPFSACYEYDKFYRKKNFNLTFIKFLSDSF